METHSSKEGRRGMRFNVIFMVAQEDFLEPIMLWLTNEMYGKAIYCVWLIPRRKKVHSMLTLHVLYCVYVLFCVHNVTPCI